MKVLFKDSNGEIHSLGDAADMDEAWATMNRLMDTVNYKPPYVRGWREDNRYVYDVGSHTEFFYIED